MVGDSPAEIDQTKWLGDGPVFFLSLILEHLLNKVTGGRILKTIIIALNSKYVHSSLAPWYLKAACDEACGEVIVREFTINENIEDILSAIYLEKADIVAFSCYIWNIGNMHRLAENISKLKPDSKIIFGGPEVSFNTIELIQSSKYVDFVISGEGELVFKSLIKHLNCKTEDKLCNFKGLTYRDVNGSIHQNPSGNLINLDILNSPYTAEMLNAVKGKIAYFEASRGCPFSCSYCLSSTTTGVRFVPMDVVKRDLKKLSNSGVRQIKFVDRTFNCNKERAKEILGFILETYNEGVPSGKAIPNEMINYHFEAGADLFDDETLQMLEKAPAGLFQLEIGIQTTNNNTLEAVHRKTDTDKSFENIRRLLSQGNIHVHLDLIAGLPYENLNSFKSSFNQVYNLKPHMLQLGFLKLLKGSSIRINADVHGYAYRSYPPYEVLYNNYISHDELVILKNVEEIVERYYNSGRFRSSLDYVIESSFSAAFDFYYEYSRYLARFEHRIQNISSRELYTLLFDYANTLESFNLNLFKELMKLDFLSSDSSGHLPESVKRIESTDFQEKCFGFLKDNNMIEKYLPDFIGVPAKQIFKKVHFEVFSLNVFDKSKNDKPIVILFDYSKKDLVTACYRYHLLDI